MTGDGYRFSWESVNGDGLELLPAGPGFWVFVTGGGLPCEVALRLHRHADGRYAFSGMSIADALPSPVEVTTQLLRQIKLGEIQAELFGPDGFMGNVDPPGPGEGAVPAPKAARYVADLSAVNGQLAGGPSRSLSDDALREFAQTYQLELARQPRRAMSAAARVHSISRATANRWAAACRDRGYLPSAPAEEPTS